MSPVRDSAPPTIRRALPVLLVALFAAGCGGETERAGGEGAAAGDTSAQAQVAAPLPPSGDSAGAELERSPRHGEWSDVPVGEGDTVRAWVVHPERPDDAPVVIVVHEIFGLTAWVRSVADRLAAAGYVAVAPDLLSGRDVPSAPDGDPLRDAAVAAVRDLDPDRVHGRIRGVAEWAMERPSAEQRYAVVGFCWGGSTAFSHATRHPDLSAAVVFYGSSPDREALRRVGSPVLGLYGGDDQRVNATLPRADSILGPAGVAWESHVYGGAGHGFLRQQAGREGANLEASRRAWPTMLDFLDRHLGGGGS